jgi:hypothetical protein
MLKLKLETIHYDGFKQRKSRKYFANLGITNEYEIRKA